MCKRQKEEREDKRMKKYKPLPIEAIYRGNLT